MTGQPGEARIFLSCEGIPRVTLPRPPSECCAKFPHYPGRVIHCKAHCEFYQQRVQADKQANSGAVFFKNTAKGTC